MCLHDDASTDAATVACLRKWANKDERVKVSFGAENQHISGASNEAIKMATGEYIGLLDHDDEMLVPIIRDILLKAIDAGGSSLKDFAGADGDLGYFQHQFVTYGREGEDCVNDGCDGIIDRINQGGRSTFYCPNCQK